MFAAGFPPASHRRHFVIIDDIPSDVTIFHHSQGQLTPIHPEKLNMPCQTLSIFCASYDQII
jgi:hypothetical protein